MVTITMKHAIAFLLVILVLLLVLLAWDWYSARAKRGSVSCGSRSEGGSASIDVGLTTGERIEVVADRQVSVSRCSGLTALGTNIRFKITPVPRTVSLESDTAVQIYYHSGPWFEIHADSDVRVDYGPGGRLRITPAEGGKNSQLNVRVTLPEGVTFSGIETYGDLVHIV